MKGSSLFGGNSFANAYGSGATIKSDSLSTTGVVVNITDEKGVFSIADTGSSVLEVTIDGNSSSYTVTSLASIIDGSVGGSKVTVYGLRYEDSLKVEITNHGTGTVTVNRLA